MASELEHQDPLDAAKQIGMALDERNVEYAVGGAIALGYWSIPRGTLDVDLTLYLPHDKPSECIWILQEIGCDVPAAEAFVSLSEHGFCRVLFRDIRLDVFLPITPFYEIARERRRRVELGNYSLAIWDAESLAVFKMMFFRRKDMADIEQLLRMQGDQFDVAWVRQQLHAMYGPRDPRLSQWDDLVRETSG